MKTRHTAKRRFGGLKDQIRIAADFDAPLDQLWLEIEQAFTHGDHSAAQMHLLKGNPVYVEAPAGSPDGVMKLYPDGRRQIVRFDSSGKAVVVAELPTLPAEQHWWRRSS
ncbi:hypothetical protein WJ21_00675 [Burkholderia vietnamiensis]|uniref:hypothetical protein n=1 Tax=Burkholderia vietnamiensis TaxID=60552 RepID=UPI00075AC3BF|nr:hypothetical protein [Burkholderia vietnamiensis]KVF92939.1 hypothetical protein WJ21_00675 [Burkholderia vietnamiensis]HDR9258353.1 hypothetical protein [Burkholderia vietnamiensis]